MEEQLKRRQNSALIGDMVARVAHEIRNPLASIELFASLLGGTTQDEVDRHHLAEQISMVVRTLDHLLSNLLVASSPPRVRIQSVSVEKLAQQIRLMAMPAIRERNIQIREQIDPRASTIEGDELMIRQSFYWPKY